MNIAIRATPILIVAGGLLVGIAIGGFVLTDAADKPEVVEVARGWSPDTGIVAVMVGKSFHATAPHVYEVFRSPSHRADGVAGDGFEPVFRADMAEGLTVSWNPVNHLKLRYRNARISQISVSWPSKHGTATADRVTISHSQSRSE